MNNLELVVSNMKAGEGTAGLLFADTTLRSTLMESAVHLEEGTSRFNENMEALKSNFLFRRYFRKKEKERIQSMKAKEKQGGPDLKGKGEQDIISKKNQ